MSRPDGAEERQYVEVEAVLLDIDGVLTDGTIWVDASGAESKRITFEDIDGVFRLKRAGIRIGFITGENTPFCEYVERRFDPDFMSVGRKDKLAAFLELAGKFELDPERTCYMGDSRHDEELLRHLRLSFVPCDVEQRVIESAGRVLRSSRGSGAVAELARWILDRPTEADNGGSVAADEGAWSEEIDSRKNREVEKASALIASTVARGGAVVHLREQRPIQGGEPIWLRMTAVAALVQPHEIMDGGCTRGDVVVVECAGPLTAAAVRAAEIAIAAGAEVVLVAAGRPGSGGEPEAPAAAVHLRPDISSGIPAVAVASLIESLRARARDT